MVPYMVAMDVSLVFCTGAYTRHTFAQVSKTSTWRARRAKRFQSPSARCANRSAPQPQIRINYPGTGNDSQFVYDPQNRCVKILETVAGSVTDTKQFVWCARGRCEERDSAVNITKKLFIRGQIASGVSHFYVRDHHGSVREITGSTGNIEGSYAYDPFGRNSLLQGSLECDYKYGGYYYHARSMFHQTLFRFYRSDLGRWLNRDPARERGGANLFAYVGNDPIFYVDPSGLKQSKASGANEIEKAKSEMDRICECCVSGKAAIAACKKQARDVVDSLKKAWNDNYSDFPWDNVGDKVGGNYCWDWSAYFQQAVSGTSGNTTWVASNVGMSGGPGSKPGSTATHHAANVGIKGNKSPYCVVCTPNRRQKVFYDASVSDPYLFSTSSGVL